MIYNSYIWKKDLNKQLEIIRENNIIQKLSKEESFDEIEKAIFLSGFMIRKLMDSRTKVTDHIDNLSILIEVMDATDSPTILNAHRIEQHYDLEKRDHVAISLRNICNMLIHSFVFEFSIGDNELIDGFYIVADRNKDKALYYVALDQWADAISTIVHDNVISMTLHFDDNGKAIIHKS